MGRGIVDWRDNLDEAILHGDLDTKAAELALGLHPHVAEGFGIEVAGVRVERREHALDGKLDQVLVADLFHVVGSHALEHLAEQFQLSRSEEHTSELQSQMRKSYAGYC